MWRTGILADPGIGAGMTKESKLVEAGSARSNKTELESGPEAAADT